MMPRYPRIRDLREDADLLQKDLAKVPHCSRQVYSDYEPGKADIPTDALMKLAAFYNVTTDYILGRKELVAMKRALPHEAETRP